MRAASPVADLSIDFETASLVDLRRTGARTYAQHPSTRVLCMAYAFDDEDVQVWVTGQPFPPDVLDHVMNMHAVHAWNAAFEYEIWNYTLLRQIGQHASASDLSRTQLHDTMATAAYWGLPLSLDAAAPAAGVRHKKDKEGHRLMMQLCKPRTVNAVTGEVTWWHEDEPDKLDRLVEYCRQDVVVERAIKSAIPSHPDAERQVWLLDHRINDRGVTVDYTFVERLKGVSVRAANRATQDVQRLTGGAVKSINAHKAFLTWLQAHGYPEDNLRRATVEARLDDPACVGLEREGLGLRLDAARTSAAKLNAMLDACPVRRTTGTVHGMLQYYGASRTGRWSGRLIQMQNMPRGSISNVSAAITLIEGGATDDQIEALFGPIMGVVASCLRGCIVAPPGKVLVVPDFSQIEARVLPWLAGQIGTLDAFRRGEDIYVIAAAGIYGIDPKDVTKAQRQIGKVAILALGFGGGKGAFLTMAANYGLTLPEEQAEGIKAAWREANPKIVSFWWDLDRAARQVIQNPTKVVAVGRLRVGMFGAHLIIRLPSGRALVYRDARLVANADRPGTQDISYMGINQYTRKWERLRTYGGKLAENVTQAVARDVMADAMLRADADGHEIVLTVHDEILALAPEGRGQERLDDLIGIMRVPPAWAAGLPTDADGWFGQRYRK